MTAQRLDSHGLPCLPRPAPRVLSFLIKSQLDHAVRRIAHKRTHKCSMNPPVLNYPCFFCGASMWGRRPDLHPACDACHAKMAAQRHRMHVRESKRRNPEATKQMNRRSYHRRKEHGPPRAPPDKGKQAAWFRRWWDGRTDWQIVRDRADKRANARRITDMRRYARAFNGEHHRNRRPHHA